MLRPSPEELSRALADAGTAHHEYEQVTLSGKRDELWPGFYAAFALGRLGNFAAPSTLSSWLEEAPTGENWSTSAAYYIIERMTA